MQLLYADPAHTKGCWWAAPASLSLQERIFLTLSNYIFTAVFLAEMTVKVKAGSRGWLGPCFPAGVETVGLRGGGWLLWSEGWDCEEGGR